MPRDIFGGKPRGPSNEDIEREAQRELERLTRATGPNMGAMGGGLGGPAAPTGLGPKSPLEAMADGLTQRRRVKKKRGAPAPVEDKSSWTGFSPASISGSVGSTLGFGGGVAPGTARPAPPPDAKPLKRQAAEDDDDDSEDDDLFATEIALRDHAERFGKNLEDMVIRSDPGEAEAMREAAMARFVQRASASEAPEDFTPPVRLNLRRRGRLRPVQDSEPEADDDDLGEEPEEQDLQELEEELVAEQQGQGAESEGAEEDGDGERPPLPQVGLMVDERARMAERRAELAEERAELAEARAESAELELTAAADLLATYEQRVADLEAELEAAEAAQAEAEAAHAEAGVPAEAVEEVEEEEDAQAPPRRSRKPPPKRAAGAKKAVKATKAGKAAKAAKKAAPAKAAAGAKKAARKRTPPPAVESALDDDGPKLGGVLGRRLAQKSSKPSR